MKTIVIAEAGDNHNGSILMAKELVDVAVEAGADYVKFQTFKSEEVISCYAPKAEYQKASTGNSESQLEMVKKLELTDEQQMEVFSYCQKKRIKVLSTPFDLPSLHFLTNVAQMPVLKIASGEITSGPLLLAAAQSGSSIILSTGMSTLGDIETALGVLAYGFLDVSGRMTRKDFYDAFCSAEGQAKLKEKVTLLHCTTEYPSPFSEANLHVLKTLRSAFGLPVGLSDHTSGISTALAAVALGAEVIEKHFTLDKNLPGPDHQASLEPNELCALVQGIREVELSLGKGIKVPTATEVKNREIARKSIVARCDIALGEEFSERNLTFKRPGTGISPIDYWSILGKKACKPFEKDEVIQLYGVQRPSSTGDI